MNNVVIVLPILLVIAVCAMCYLGKLGFHQLRFKGTFGPTSAEFTAERRESANHSDQVLVQMDNKPKQDSEVLGSTKEDFSRK